MFLLFCLPFLNGFSYRNQIELILKIFWCRLISFFKKVSSCSRSRDILSWRCCNTYILGSRQKSNFTLFWMFDTNFDYVPLKISKKETLSYDSFLQGFWICNQIDKFLILKIWPCIVIWPEKCTCSLLKYWPETIFDCRFGFLGSKLV